jgi:hypothetical protein
MAKVDAGGRESRKMIAEKGLYACRQPLSSSECPLVDQIVELGLKIGLGLPVENPVSSCTRFGRSNPRVESGEHLVARYAFAAVQAIQRGVESSPIGRSKRRIDAGPNECRGQRDQALELIVVELLRVGRNPGDSFGSGHARNIAQADEGAHPFAATFPRPRHAAGRYCAVMWVELKLSSHGGLTRG